MKIKVIFSTEQQQADENGKIFYSQLVTFDGAKKYELKEGFLRITDVDGDLCFYNTTRVLEFYVLKDS